MSTPQQQADLTRQEREKVAHAMEVVERRARNGEFRDDEAWGTALSAATQSDLVLQFYLKYVGR